MCVSILHRSWITRCCCQCVCEYVILFAVFYIVQISLVVVGIVCVSIYFVPVSLVVVGSIFYVLVSLVFAMLLSAALSRDVRPSVIGTLDPCLRRLGHVCLSNTSISICCVLCMP